MVANLLKNSAKIFWRKQTNILSASIVLMVAVLSSRLLGLVRDRLLAGVFFAHGNQWQLDVYFAAFRLPDMVFQLLVMGALSAAFIPVFSRFLDKSEKEAWYLASAVITLAGGIFLILAALIVSFTWPLSRLIAPTFNAEQLDLMTQLTRIMLVAQFFFVISNFFTGILQSYQRFLLPALAPIAYNVGIIFGILVLAPSWGIYGPTLGVVLGAFLHLLIQAPLLWRFGFVYRPIVDWRHPGVRKIGKLMLPRTLSLAVSQVELTVGVFIATSLTAGSLSIFYLAQHLSVLPVGLFGLTIGQAALPALSQEAEKGLGGFKKVFLASCRQILYLAMPAGVLLIVLRIPLVRIAFGARTFPWEATLLTGKVVAILAASVFAQALIQILVRGFYALQDTVTPLLIGLASVIVSVSLSFWLVFGMKWGIVGLSTAISLASLFQGGLLLLGLKRKIDGFGLRQFTLPFLKMLLASFLTGVALWLPMRFLDQFVLDTTKTVQLVLLTLVAGFSGLLVYLGFSKLLRIEELEHFWQTLRRFGAWQKILAESDEVLDASAAPSATPTAEE
jgi:putative peptidoglycan lipid II flippase